MLIRYFLSDLQMGKTEKPRNPANVKYPYAPVKVTNQQLARGRLHGEADSTMGKITSQRMSPYHFEAKHPPIVMKQSSIQVTAVGPLLDADRAFKFPMRRFARSLPAALHCC